MSQIDNHLEGISHVLIQGDTTTVFATALAAYHRNIPVIHLEAGLRTWDNKNPYPEEFNRLLKKDGKRGACILQKYKIIKFE